MDTTTKAKLAAELEKLRLAVEAREANQEVEQPHERIIPRFSSEHYCVAVSPQALIDTPLLPYVNRRHDVKHLMGRLFYEEICKILALRNETYKKSQFSNDNIYKMILWLTRDDYLRRPGLLVMGEIGSGKSTAMRALMAVYSRFLRNFTDSTDAFIPVPVADVNEHYERGDGHFLEWCKAYRNMYIDDLGKASIQDRYKTARPIEILIMERYANHLPTFFTTNMSADDIASTFEPHVVDRLKDMCTQLLFKGDSYREAKEQTTVYESISPAS